MKNFIKEAWLKIYYTAKLIVGLATGWFVTWLAAETIYYSSCADEYGTNAVLIVGAIVGVLIFSCISAKWSK